MAIVVCENKLIVKDERKWLRAYKNLPYVFVHFDNKLDLPNLVSSDYFVMTKSYFKKVVEEKTTG